MSETAAPVGVAQKPRRTLTRAVIRFAGGDPERVEGASISWNLFPFLGIKPALGRTFHPRFVRRADGAACVLEHAARAAANADLRDQGENDVLSRDAGRQLAVHMHLEGFRLALQQALRGQHLFHFAGADAESQRAKRAVRCRMAIAADYRHAGLRESEFGSDYVYDALPVRMDAEAAYAELGTVGFELFELLTRNRIDDRQRAVRGRNAVIRGGNGEIGTAHLEAALAQALEGLGRRHLVYQVEIDVEQCGRAGALVNYVVVPEFFDDRAWHKFSLRARLSG